MTSFFKIFILVLIIDIAIGFSMSYFTGNSEPNIIFKIIDEIISIPVSIWNRLFPKHGIYAATTNVFWFVIVFNAIVQALVIWGIRKLVRK